MLQAILYVPFEALIDYAQKNEIPYFHVDVVDPFLAAGKRESGEALGYLDTIVLERLRRRLTLQQAVKKAREVNKRAHLTEFKLFVVQEKGADYQFLVTLSWP